MIDPLRFALELIRGRCDLGLAGGLTPGCEIWLTAVVREIRDIAARALDDDDESRE